MPICIIPARGGSKRIPHKNIRPFNGKPMIAHSIAAAQQSGCFTRIIVSTDSEAIAATAREHGAETPFLRPPELADDFTTTGAVMRHAVSALAEERQPENTGSPHSGCLPEICCLYATAPFVRPEDLQRGLDILRQSRADYAFAVTGFPFPIQRALRIDGSGSIAMFQPENFAKRSQDLEEAWTQDSSTGAPPPPGSPKNRYSTAAPPPSKSRAGACRTSTPPKTGFAPKSCSACWNKQTFRQPETA